MEDSREKARKASFERAKEEGNRCLERHDFPKAIVCYTEAMEYSEDDNQFAILYSNRSFAKLKAGKYYEALEDALSCTRFCSAWSKGHFRVGEVHRALGNYESALECYRRAAECDPEDFELYRIMKHMEYLVSVEKSAQSRSSLEICMHIPASFKLPFRCGLCGFAVVFALILIDKRIKSTNRSTLCSGVAFGVVVGLIMKLFTDTRREEILKPDAVRRRDENIVKLSKSQDSLSSTESEMPNGVKKSTRVRSTNKSRRNREFPVEPIVKN